MIDTYSGIEHEETTKLTHVQPVLLGSKILIDFKIGGISSYYLF
jgi:hypothetical protein